MRNDIELSRAALERYIPELHGDERQRAYKYIECLDRVISKQLKPSTKFDQYWDARLHDAALDAQDATV